MFKSIWRYCSTSNKSKVVYTEKYFDVLINKHTKEKFAVDKVCIYDPDKLPHLINESEYEKIICQEDQTGLSTDDLLKEIAVNTFLRK